MVVGPDLVDVLVDDHRQIEGLLHAFADGEADDSRLTVAIAELARHIVVEEEYLYPLISEILPHGAEMAGDELARSQEAERLMKRLEGSRSEADRLSLVADLERVVCEHIQSTERDIFPALRQVCAPDRLDHLGGVVELAKRTAPTRPHPAAPARAPLTQILSPGIGLVDRIRDAITGRPTKPDEL